MDYEIDHNVQFYGVLKSTKHLISILKAINIRNVATCFIHENGITVTVEEPRSVKAIAYIKSHLFDIYNLKQTEEDIPPFGLPLGTFINCLQSLIPSSGSNALEILSDYCEIKYDGTGSYLNMKRSIKEYSQVTHCNLIPFEPEEEGVELSFSDNTGSPSQKLILKSDWFKGIFNDLDKRCEIVTMKFSPSNPSFSIIAEGGESVLESDYPENAEPFVTFSCDQPLTYSYPYPQLVLCKKALDISTEVSIEMFNNGALRMLLKIEGGSYRGDFVEFSFLPSTSFS